MHHSSSITPHTADLLNDRAGSGLTIAGTVQPIVGTQHYGTARRSKHRLSRRQQVEKLRPRQTVEHLPALWPTHHQSAVPQARNMRGHCRLSKTQLSHQISHSSLTTAGQSSRDR
ncbi:hypothetical protein SAMN04488550_2374 [Gordonia malaquae]|nr:hypothetical protein SAMN04488550_2374 [Gordonia malaquae]